MIPIKQTLTDELYGNCLQASIASLLDRPLDNVPNFMLFEDHWWSALLMWAGSNGYSVEYVESEPPKDGKYYVTSLVYEIHKKGLSHAVVFKDGQIAHNPWVNSHYDNFKYRIDGYYKFIPRAEANAR